MKHIKYLLVILFILLVIIGLEYGKIGKILSTYGGDSIMIGIIVEILVLIWVGWEILREDRRIK